MAALIKNSFILLLKTKEMSPPEHWEECEMGKRLLEKKQISRQGRKWRKWEEPPAEFCSLSTKAIGPPAGINGCISISKSRTAEVPRERRSK